MPLLRKLRWKKKEKLDPHLGKNLSTPLDDYHLEELLEKKTTWKKKEETPRRERKSSVGEREATITCPFSSLRKKATFGSALNSGGRPLSSDTSLNFGR